MEHVNIPDGERHEPKGASTALSGTFYKSDGSGSGSWGKLTDSNVEGLGPNSPAGRRVVTDGNGGFDIEPTSAFAFGTMNLTANTVGLSVTAATDTSLRTNSDYKEVGLAFTFDNIENMTQGSNFLEITEAGLYSVDYWANIRSSVNNTKFGLKFVKNGSFVTRPTISNLITNGILHNQSANGIHEFNAGDQVKIYIAADKNCIITIEDLTFQMLFLRAI